MDVEDNEGDVVEVAVDVDIVNCACRAAINSTSTGEKSMQIWRV